MAKEEGSNGFDGDEIAGYLEEIDKNDDKLLSLKSEYMSKCKTPRGKIREVMKQAKDGGLNMPAFRTIVAKHRAERKIEERIAKLEADDQADYEAMKEALGDFGSTELGEAALKRGKPDDGKLDTLRT